MSVPPPVRPLPDLAVSLDHAVVTTSDTPLLLLDGDLVVVAVSGSLCRAFDLEPAEVTGRPVFAMGSGEWANPRLGSLLNAVVLGGAEIDSYEMDLESDRGPRKLELSAHMLIHADPDKVRLLLSVADRTDAREVERQNRELVAEKVLLIQELNHRVANSLQIIASVLMQSARRVSNEEIRSHLQKAHNRVMSVAAIQKQLASTGAAEVPLLPYFTQLCSSIGASMIPDPDLLAIKVDVDDSHVHSDVSISLGLIVTELVINALKHAYPDDQGGVITVTYASDESGWTLAVNDDGIGMPPAADRPAQAGLGTSIVEALARQLQARITIAPAHPGTSVTIVHQSADSAGADVLPLVRAL